MSKPPTVYIETTIVSYLTARPSSIPMIAERQKMTAEWWTQVRPQVQTYISPTVLEEAEKGDVRAAELRLIELAEIPVVAFNDSILSLANTNIEAMRIPRRATLDAFHLAFGVQYRMDYLLTWNRTHLSSGRVRRILHSLNAEMQVHVPIICTPEELMEV